VVIVLVLDSFELGLGLVWEGFLKVLDYNFASILDYMLENGA
jgi:hypothetical protein